jgi:hypothetical protein
MAKRKKYNPLKMQAAARRKAHFAAGGTTTMWRGRAVTLDETHSKARQDKLVCRKPINRKDYE